MTPEEEAKLNHDAVRDLASGHANVLIALDDDSLASQTRAVLETARVQLGWSTAHVSQVVG